MFHRRREEYLGRGILEGIALSQPHTKITAHAAKMATDYVGRVETYTCRVYETEEDLIIRWKFFIAISMRKIILRYSAIERYFIFARDPRLVVIGTMVQCSKRCAFILIRMKNSELAIAVCRSIEIRRSAFRKNIISQVSGPIIVEERLLSKFDGNIQKIGKNEDYENLDSGIFEESSSSDGKIGHIFENNMYPNYGILAKNAEMIETELISNFSPPSAAKYELFAITESDAIIEKCLCSDLTDNFQGILTSRGENLSSSIIVHKEYI